MKKKNGGYDPVVELGKGAELTAATYDKTQKIAVTAAKVTVGGIAGEIEISGIATGRLEPGIDGTMDIWLSIFRFMRPDGTTNHVAGWNIAVVLAPGQRPEATAQAFVDYINSGTRPYKAAAAKEKVKIIYQGKD